MGENLGRLQYELIGTDSFFSGWSARAPIRWSQDTTSQERCFVSVGPGAKLPESLASVPSIETSVSPRPTAFDNSPCASLCTWVRAFLVLRVADSALFVGYVCITGADLYRLWAVSSMLGISTSESASSSFGVLASGSRRLTLPTSTWGFRIPLQPERSTGISSHWF